MNLWERHRISNSDLFNLETLSRNFKEMVLKYASSYPSPQPISQTQTEHKSSIQMLLDENTLQASEFKKTNDDEASVDIDWLDFAYKSSVDEESLSDDACYVYDTLNELINRMRTTEAAPKVSACNGKVAVIDFSNATLGDLQFLMQLFTGCSLDEAKHYSIENMLQSLSGFVPLASIQAQPSSQSDALPARSCSACNRGSWFFSSSRSRLSCCQICSKSFCSHCILKRRIYQINLSSLLIVCKLCVDKFDKQDAELWKEKCLSLIEAKDLPSVMAAHGCMAMAVCDNLINANELLCSVAKKLAEQKFYESSLEFFTTSLFTCTDTESVKACVAIGSTLQSFAADSHNTEYMDQIPLLMAANSAYTCAQIKKTKCSVEIPYLDKKAESITRKLNDAYNTEKKMHAKKAAFKLETAWACRNCYDMMSVLLESDQGFESHFDDYAMIGLEQFLVTKVKFIDTMRNEDSAAILFFQGILKLHKNNCSAGLLDMEKAVWKGYHSGWMPKAAIDVLIFMFSNSQYTTPHENLLTVFKTLTVTDLFSNDSKCLTSLCLKPAHLVTPSTRQWPDLSVTGVNSRATFKYEQAAIKLFKEGKWTAKNVALAYIDFIPSHEHPAEICACFLLAGLWFLKELEAVVSVNKSQTFIPKVYATKRAVFVCTGLAFCASQEHFHLGMQLYASRVGLQIVLRAKECAQFCFTKEDGNLLSHLFKVVIQTSRLFPFWDIPIVMACEAPLLHILTGELHSEFVLSLQHVAPEKHMLFKDHELKYQLYENNLRRLCPLENPDEAQLQAMNSMLIERGWSMEDVSHLMTSPLSPRSPDGWLIQQPKLGVSMEYALIDGFVLDLENPSLELLVVKADATHVGLISQNDLSECLQLPNNALFFSLDPPDEDHRYHPYQAFRYEPKELQGSTLLHTMFETDYLMKSFSVGTEVSSMPPFKQRPCKEGLLAQLPQHLQNSLRPMSERGQSWSHMQRFWIQADELVYDESISNGKLTVKLKKPKMTIQTHSQMIDTDGKLKDTSENVNPDSPEFKFAEDMTTNYDEIGKYFPMFARLQEIVKLWFISIIVQNTLEEFKNKAQGKDLEVPTRVLEEIQQRERRDRLEKIGNMLSQAERQYRSNTDNFYHQPSNARSQIISHLLEMCRGYGSRSTMEDKVNRWLDNYYSAEGNLIDYISGCIERASESDLSKLRDAARQAGYSSGGDQLVTALKQQIKNNVSSVTTQLKSQYQTLKGNCDYQLTLAKPQIVKELTDIFKGAKEHDVKRLVDRWLDSYSGSSELSECWSNLCLVGSDELSNYLCDCLPKTTSHDIKQVWQADYQRKYPLLSKLVDDLKGTDVRPKLVPNFCNWVPAALLHTEKKNSFCLCYGGVLIGPKLIRSPIYGNSQSVRSPVGRRNPNDSRKYYQNPPPTGGSGGGPKQNTSIKGTSVRSYSNGATQFPFNPILNPRSTNTPLNQLQLKDRFTQILGFKSQRNSSSLIRHPDKSQGNVRAQNNARAHRNAQRTIINSGRKFSQMQSRGMHSQAGSGGQRSSGRQKGRSSSAAGFGAGAVLGAGGGRGGGGGGDGSGDDSDDDTTKYVRWSGIRWISSKEGSYMQPIPAYGHIPYRNVSYIEIKLDGENMWISLHPSGYKFNAWKVQSQDKDTLKLKLDSQFNANGKKIIKEDKKSE